MVLTGEDGSTQMKSFTNATVSTTNPTWTGLGWNSGLGFEMGTTE